MAFIKNALPPTLTGPIARHSSASLGTKLFATGCGFMYAVAAARLLGPAGYGMVSVALSTATICATLALLGTNGLAVREAAALTARAAWTELRCFVRWSTLMVLGASCALGMLLAVTSFAAGPYKEALLLASAAVPLLAGLHLLRGITQGTGLIVAAQLPLDVIRWVIALLLIAILLLNGASASPPDILLIVLTSFVFALLVAGAVLRHYFSKVPRAQAFPPVAPSRLAQSMPFLGIAMFGIIGTEINTLLLGWLAGPREAGLYQPIARLAPIMILAREAVEMPLAPRAVKLWNGGCRLELARLLQRSALACTLATAAIAATILAASPYIFAAFGPEFEEYQGYLYWIAAAQVINAALGASPMLLAMVGSMKRRLQAQAVTLTVQAGLALLLVPAFGAAGAAFALAGAIVTWSVLHWAIARRVTGIDTSIFSALRIRRS